ncbi:MAG: nucleoside triphosphate pyrophosphohydrolase [Tissierellia bacterium]|nr:nucleoside triphosphate pyrophosphohydrolase [Tissierellia bacterium]
MGTIYIMGLGPGNPDWISMAVYNRIIGEGPHFLRTSEHGAVEIFENNNIPYESFDRFYEDSDSFEEVYGKIVEKLISAAEYGDVNYYVPGDPHVAEKTVIMLMEANVKTEVLSGISFIEPVLKAVGKDSVSGLVFLNGEGLSSLDLDIHRDLLITQIYNQHLLSELKLALSEIYGDEYYVMAVHSAGTVKESMQRITVTDLDREVIAGHETAIFVPVMPKDKKIYDMRDVLEIMMRLRAPGGCPWDIEQTHSSIRNSLIEEAYELVQTIDEDNIEAMVEELGDYLLQWVFHLLIGYENGEFYPIDVTTVLADKLIYRHPHVFLQKKVANTTDVGYNWDKLKYGRQNIHRFIDKLNSIPALPSTMVAQKIIHKCASIDFIWDGPEGPAEKVKEELLELEQALINGDEFEMEKELGDILFSVCSLAYMLGIDPELALTSTNRKFIGRFEIMDRLAHNGGKELETLSREQLEELWQRAKELE